MKTKLLTLVMMVSLLFPFSGVGSAAVEVYVDSAPNVYGSPDWDPWWTDAKKDVASGSFIDMRSGTYPETHLIDPYDEIVYSTGDLGGRIHWIYWVPDETVSDLEDLFQVKWSIDWAGTDWTLDGSDWVLDEPEKGWSEPSSWEDYDTDADGAIDGVIGSVGFAWWATDNEAPPLDTGGSVYDEVDQADVDALREQVLANQTYALGQVRYRESTSSEWEITSLQVDVIPEPATTAIWSLLALAGIGLISWRRRRQASA